MDKISKYIQKINHTITVAGLNHDIWWTYKKKKYRKILLYVQDFYPSIFSTSVHAHFVATIMAAYQLLEDRNKKDTITFHYLLDILEQSKKLNAKEIRNFRRRIKNLKPLWVKISILRNKVFGHATNDLNINPWKEAKITPNDIKRLIKRYQKLINDISCKCNGHYYDFCLSAKKDTTNLLKDLKTYNNALHLTGRSAQSSSPQ